MTDHADACCSSQTPDAHDRAAPVAAAQPARGVGRRGLATLLGATALLTPALASRAKADDNMGAALAPLAVGKTHTLPSTPDTVQVGAMDPTRPIALEIDSGDVVYYPNTWTNWGNEPKYGMTFAQRNPIRLRYPQGPFSMIGPVSVKGAEPGDVIECRMLRLKPINWGWNSAPPGVGALPADFHKPYLQYFRFDEARKYADFANGVRIPLSPVQGVMATQPAGTTPYDSLQVGRNGGMVALRGLTEGTSLFLPVDVPGARVWTGGSWATVGDGVVDNVAIESAMEDLRIQYVLHKQVALDGPIAETPTEWIVLGYGGDLDDALTSSLRRTIAWLSGATSLSPQQVYALCSVAGSVRTSQYSHQTKTVYAFKQLQAMYTALPKNIFDTAMLDRISQSLRPEA